MERLVDTATIKEVSGASRLGSYVLDVEVGLSLRTFEGTNLNNAKIVEVKGLLHVMQNQSYFPVGNLHQKRLVPIPTRLGNADTALEMVLTSKQIEAIEKARSGGNLNFRIDLDFRYAVNSFGNYRGDTSGHQIHVTDSIPQSEWVECLDKMGYQETLMLEIPIPPAESHPELHSAMKNLKEARRTIVSGPAQSSMQTLRLAMDALYEVTGDAKVDDQEPGFQKLVDGLRNWSKGTRIRNIRRGLKILLDATTHGQGEAGNMNWERRDAECVAMIFAALVRWETNESGQLILRMEE